MILLAAQAPIAVLLVVLILGFIVMSLVTIAMMTRFYRKPPAGTVMVIKRMQGRIRVTKTGAVVVPLIQSCHFVHCAVEEIELQREDGRIESLFVCLKDDPEAAIVALEKLGEKPVDEIKRLIARMLEKNDDHERTLAQIGYKLVV